MFDAANDGKVHVCRAMQFKYHSNADGRAARLIQHTAQRENVQNVSTNQDLLVQVPTWQVFANPKNADVAGWRI